ncbi:MAG: glycosyltransferase family 1 protein [Planctomycetia bacterium]|nr:glycosyltransferase family 1 protein [Planctomycetia bacterium]
MPPLRVLHCPTTTGGNPPELARAERKLGLESWSAAIYHTRFDYEVDEVPSPGRLWWLKMEAKRWSLLYRALKHFDLVHFNFGQSLMPTWNGDGAPALRRYPWLARRLYGVYGTLLETTDLPMLKRAGKGIVVTYQGDDARQGDYCREHFDVTFADEVPKGYYSPRSDRRKRSRIARFARFADRIYALNPDLLHVLPASARFLPYAHLDLNAWTPAAPRSSHAHVPIVLHAPTDREVKGTRFILDAVARLKADGTALELVLVENVSHAEMPAMYAQADLVVDQLLAGWYGGAAVEAMSLGKPVVSYIRETDLKFVPPAMRDGLPLIQATPETVYDVLRHWLTDGRPALAERGQQGRRFVERWHDPMRIAAELKADYEAIMAGKRPSFQKSEPQRHRGTEEG